MLTLMLLAFIGSLAQAQAHLDWLLEPVSPTLHTVGPAFLYDWRQNTHRIVGGDQASPLFQNTAAAMDVHWRLAAYDTEQPILLDEQQRQARKLAWMGTTLGLHQTIEQMLSGSPEFSAIYRSMRTITAPSVELRGRRPDAPGSRVQVMLNQGSRNRAASNAQFSESPRRRQTSRLRLGGGVSVVRRDLPGDREDDTELAIGYQSSLEVDRIGPLSFRARSVLLRSESASESLQVSWSGSARLPLVHGLSAMGGITGSNEDLFRLSTGLELRLRRVPRTTLRLIAMQRPDLSEERITLSLVRQSRWPAPVDIDGWPLGAELDAHGVPALVFPERDPHVLTSLLPPLPGTTPIGELAPPDTHTSLARRHQLGEGLGGVPGDVGVAALVELGQQGQGAMVPDEAQGPDGVEGDRAVRFCPAVLDVLHEERYRLRVLEASQGINGQ